MLYKQKNGKPWRFGGCVGCNRRWRGCFDSDNRRSLCDTFGICFLYPRYPENNPYEIWEFHHTDGFGPASYPFPPPLIERMQGIILARLSVDKPQLSHRIFEEFPRSVRLAVYPALRELAEADIIDAFVTAKGYCYHLKRRT